MKTSFPAFLFLLLFPLLSSAQKNKIKADSLARLDSVRTYTLQASLLSMNAMQIKIEAMQPDGKGGYVVNQLKAGEAQNLFVQSRYYYRKAISFDSTYYLAWSNLGTTYYFEGLTKVAIPYFVKSIHLNPDYAQGWFNLGKSYDLLGKKDSAVYAFQQSIRSDSAFLTPYVEYSRILFQDKDTTNGFRYLRLAATNIPKAELPWTSMSAQYFALNDSVRGMAALEQAAKLQQSNIGRLEILLNYFQQKGNSDKAAYYTKLVALERKSQDIPREED